MQNVLLFHSVRVAQRLLNGKIWEQMTPTTICFEGVICLLVVIGM